MCDLVDKICLSPRGLMYLQQEGLINPKLKAEDVLVPNQHFVSLDANQLYASAEQEVGRNAILN